MLPDLVDRVRGHNFVKTKTQPWHPVAARRDSGMVAPALSLSTHMCSLKCQPLLQALSMCVYVCVCVLCCPSSDFANINDARIAIVWGSPPSAFQPFHELFVFLKHRPRDLAIHRSRDHAPKLERQSHAYIGRGVRGGGAGGGELFRCGV